MRKSVLTIAGAFMLLTIAMIIAASVVLAWRAPLKNYRTSADVPPVTLLRAPQGEMCIVADRDR